MYVNNNTDDLLDISFVVDEAPIGWSSTCLDQTIFYYLEQNHENEDLNESNDLYKVGVFN